MMGVVLTTLAGVALAAPFGLALLDGRGTLKRRPQPASRVLITTMRGLPPENPPDVPHRYDQPPNVLIMHSRHGWHCVCNDTHPEPEPCWCNTFAAVPVIPGRPS